MKNALQGLKYDQQTRWLPKHCWSKRHMLPTMSVVSKSVVSKVEPHNEPRAIP